jgi:hypothetical protein
MNKKHKKIADKKAPLMLAGAFLVVLSLGGCAATQGTPVATYQNMTCAEILAEMESLNSNITVAKSNSEVGRAVDTGASVAATGASVAGVPYVGAVYSIGKTLFNHAKVTRRSNADIAQENLYAVESVAYEKGCL